MAKLAHANAGLILIVNSAAGDSLFAEVAHANHWFDPWEISISWYSVVFGAQTFDLSDSRLRCLSEPIGAIPCRTRVVVKIKNSNGAVNRACTESRGAYATTPLRVDELRTIVGCVQEFDAVEVISNNRSRQHAILCSIALAGILAICADFIRIAESRAYLDTHALAVGSAESQQGFMEVRMRTLKSLALASSLLVGASASAQDAVEWRVADGGNGHWYELRELTSLSWVSHRDAATELGGHLVTITDSGENLFVRSLIPMDLPGDGQNYIFGPTIGLVQRDGSREPAGGWEWVTGEPFTFSDWFPAEPSNSGGGEHWVRFRFMNQILAWNDVVDWLGDTHLCCNPLVNRALIEWSADCNNDGIIDYGQIRAGELADLNSNNIPDCCEQSISCIPCDADVDESGAVNGVDLAGLLNNWGSSGGKQPRSDIDGNGVVDAMDLSFLLNAWGPCQ